MTDFLANPTLGTPIDPSGWWVCEEHAGQRVFWDGGVSENIPAQRIPWSGPRASGETTGFWNMNGEPVSVPKRLYQYLPAALLEGVITRQREFSVYSCPPLDSIFRTRQIRPNWEIDYQQIKAFYDTYGINYLDNEPVDSELLNLSTYLGQGPVYLRHHVKLPMNNSVGALNDFMRVANRRKARAVWLRLPRSVYTPGNSAYFRVVKL